MDLVNLFQTLNQLEWFGLIFKIIAIIFSVGFFGYSVIFQQQLIKMEKNALIYYYLLEHPENTDSPPRPLIFSFGLLQLFVGITLIIVSLFLV